MGELNKLAATLLRLAKDADVAVITAESCTAGLMSQILSDAEGAADTFHGGFVTYTKEHKTCALDVPAELLRDQGAVCGEVVRAMAFSRIPIGPWIASPFSANRSSGGVFLTAASTKGLTR